MNPLNLLNNLLPGPAHQPISPSPRRAHGSDPTLLQCGGQAIRDLFVPGRQGEKARIHSQYQLCKKLGVHQALDAQAHSQDFLSQTGRAVHQVGKSVSSTTHRVSAGTQEALTVARDFYRDEAKTAVGPYRALIGAGQGAQITAQGLFSTVKTVTKLGVGSAEFTYRGLRGEVNFQDLLRKGGEGALTLAARGANYVASGRLPDDAKKFTKDCAGYTADYVRKLKNDPGLEVPKLLTLVAGAAALGGGAKLLNGATRMVGVGEAVATSQAAPALVVEEAVAASQAAPAVVVEEAVAAPAAALEEAAACAPRPVAGQGTIVPPGFAQRQAAGAFEAAASEPVGSVYPKGWTPRQAATSFDQAAVARPKATYVPRPTSLVPARVAPVSAPPAAAPVSASPAVAPVSAPSPAAAAAVELPVNNLPLPTKSTFCLPSNNYAPVPRTYLQMSEPFPSILDVRG